MSITAEQLKRLAAECGFELAGIAEAAPLADFVRFNTWRAAGYAADLHYLTDHRGDKRADPRSLLPSAKIVLCVGKLYNTSEPYSTERAEQTDIPTISRYAWGADYHDVLRSGLEAIVARLKTLHDEPFEYKICVDTAPLLERSYARQAGLGWIGRNTCLINQQQGSWFFLGEVLLSVALIPDLPPPDRCGTCRRCVDACPTNALIEDGEGNCRLDAKLCISYLTIEKRGEIPPQLQSFMGSHIFGCDICQDVCPWNRDASVTSDPQFLPLQNSYALKDLAALSKADFQSAFGSSPILRANHRGFLRNVAIAMGNSNSPEMDVPLRQLATHADSVVAKTAHDSLRSRSRHSDEVSKCDHL